jgi:hypothetical protein
LTHTVKGADGFSKAVVQVMAVFASTPKSKLPLPEGITEYVPTTTVNIPNVCIHYLMSVFSSLY